MSEERVDHRLRLYVSTVRQLRAAQIAHRARLRTQRLLLAHLPRPLTRPLSVRVPPYPGWPRNFVPVDARTTDGFPSAEANAQGRFEFVGEERELGQPVDWQQMDAPQLWRYHLHYYEWGWSFARHPEPAWASETFRQLWRSWRSSAVWGRCDAWTPYVASVRAWSLCGLYEPLVAGTVDNADFLQDLGAHAGFISNHLEFDVGGNHLVKNLKALIGLGMFLNASKLIERGLDRLRRQLEIQVLADGGHFERSPSYHCQVLGDLIDVANLLRTAREPLPAWLGAAINAMRGWLGAMLLPDGDVPLFNDCTLVGETRIDLLEPAPPPAARLIVLQPSGYVVVRPDARLHLVADVGLPCPRELPAHAHADCLSFELAVDGRRTVVDTGTSTYAAGPRRQYERSTTAHNTVQIDGADQTEVWATFRAARRAIPRLERADDDGETIEITASHDGYERLSGRPRHRRTWRVGRAMIEVIDEIDGEGGHVLASRFHLAPQLPVTIDGEAVSAGAVQINIEGATAQLQACEVADRFGEPLPALCLLASADARLPHRMRARFALTSPCREPAESG
jgi:uncharacterized heparinase superfamily protein